MIYTRTWNAISFSSQKHSYFNLHYAVFSHTSIWISKNAHIILFFFFFKFYFCPWLISIFIEPLQVFPFYIFQHFFFLYFYHIYIYIHVYMYFVVEWAWEWYRHLGSVLYKCTNGEVCISSSYDTVTMTSIMMDHDRSSGIRSLLEVHDNRMRGNSESEI